MKTRGWLAGCAGLALSFTAGQAMAAQAADAKVRELIDAIGVTKTLTQMNSQMAGMMQQKLPCVPASYWQGFIDASGTEQLISHMVPIYQKHFTAEDIDGLLKFYKSPLGQKVVVEMPLVVAEAAQYNRQWGQERGLQMVATLKKQGTIEANGKCPGAASTAAASQPASSSSVPASASTAAPAPASKPATTKSTRRKKKH